MKTRTVNSTEPVSSAWKAAHHKLIQNVERQQFIPECGSSVCVIIPEAKVFLPAYVPYIGPRYFEYKPRILCYAINQNLSPHVRWTRDWITRWATDVKHAQDRLNRAARDGRPIPIRPYAEGFLPLVALIAAQHWIAARGGFLPDIIDDVIAVSNFVKFSTARDASSSSIPAFWWRECAVRYVAHEIQVLRPDIIIGFGKRTELELARVVNSSIRLGRRPAMLSCRFPARMASDKVRSLSCEESGIWSKLVFPLLRRMRRPPKDSYHKWRITQFRGYFVDVVISWDAEQLGCS